MQIKTLLPINQFTQVEKKILPHIEVYTSRKKKSNPIVQQKEYSEVCITASGLTAIHRLGKSIKSS